MALFCIPRHLVEGLKASALKGEMDIKKLYEMSSQERRDFFSGHTDAELGKLINTEFEKAMISKQKMAMTDWAKSVFSPETKKKPVYKNVVDKINSLDDMGVLDEKSEKAFLEDLVADKLGVGVSVAEVMAINEKAKLIDAVQDKLGNNLGNPEKLQENLEFFRAKKNMDNYLLALTPASKLRIMTGTIGRGMMLFSIKSPLLNIGSNIEVGATEALSRRLSNGGYKGADNRLAITYVKMVNKIYQETGYDISRMMNINDTGASGARVLGNDTVHSSGKGKIRWVGRHIFEDIVFKQLMGAPDAAFASTHFADSVNMNSLKMSKGDKAQASKLMIDAMRIDPQTPNGEILRNQAVLDAQIATWTNKTWASKVSESVRRVLNDVSGDMRIGDYLLPFVKTPANVIATGIDYAGMGYAKALAKTYDAIKNGELEDSLVRQDIFRNIVRSGLGTVFSLILAGMFDDDDFVGAYDPSRAQIEKLKNSNYNAVLINGEWVSMDWFGPLSVPVTAMLYARKYGKSGIKEMAFQYSRSVWSNVWEIPGVSDLKDYNKANQYKEDQTLQEMTGETQDYIMSQVSSRLIPSILSDVAKATDPYQRQTSKGADSIKAKTPGLRQTLPVKTNIFGEDVMAEPWWSSVLFGSRFKTNRTTETIKELQSVMNNNDKAINFTDWDKSSAKNLAQFREKVGDEKYNEAKKAYGQELKERLGDTFRTGKYKRLDDSEKLKLINSMDAEVIDYVFKKYHFKYKKDK